MSMIEELYMGNIHPVDKYVKKGEKYQRLATRLAACTDELLSALDDRGAVLLREICEIESEMETISDRESFVDGFCIGARLMQEVMEADRIDREVL